MTRSGRAVPQFSAAAGSWRAPLAAGCLAALLVALPAPCADEGAPLDPLVKQLVQAWQARDLEAYLALWDPAQVEAVASERETVKELFASDECRLAASGGARVAAAATLSLPVQAFCVAEPFGRLLRGSFQIARRPEGWRITEHTWFGAPEPLVHLSLDPRGYKAAGHVLHLEDFELRMLSGSLFTSPAVMGPTLLVFVGEGEVRFSPQPDSEKEELRQFCGRREMVERVRTAFVRIEPLDLERVLTPAALEMDPAGPERYPAAREVYERSATAAYSLDSPLPRSPWNTFPPSGNAAVIFDTRRGTLTFAVTSQPENLSLFDRARRRQICLYPGEGQSFDYYEDEYNDVDILHHDLRVRLEPDRPFLQAQDTLRFRLRSESATVRLKLDEGLTVHEVTDASGAPCLYFRQRAGTALVVTLGAPTPPGGEALLTIRYSGPIKPAQRDVEQLQTVSDETFRQQWEQEAPQVYSSEPDWYPQADFTDYATSHLEVDVPAGYTVVSGGQRGPTRTEGRRVITEYVQERPTRYLVMVVGRLSEAGAYDAGGVKLTGYGTGETRSEVPNLIERSARILAYFERLFGPCPYPSLALVYTAGLTPGGHSPPAMTILSKRSLLLRPMETHDPADFSDVPDFFLAHELAHQWWGHAVAPANYRERWLSEGVAHYAAALWVRHDQGEKAFGDVLDRMAGWARRDTDRGPLFLGRRIGHQKHDSRAYRAVVYDKGAVVLHALAAAVGETAFFTGLQDLQNRRRFETTTTQDLRRSLEAASGQDPEPYLAMWVRSTTLPRLSWSEKAARTAEGWTTNVSVSPASLPGPMPLDITAETLEGAETVHRILPPGGGVFSLTTRGQPRRVTIGAGWMVLLASPPRRQ